MLPALPSRLFPSIPPSHAYDSTIVLRRVSSPSGGSAAPPHHLWVLHALFFLCAPLCSWTTALSFHLTSLKEPSRYGGKAGRPMSWHSRASRCCPRVAPLAEVGGAPSSLRRPGGAFPTVLWHNSV